MGGSPIRLVLFDLGGVLVELSGVPVLLSWLGNCISVDELWARWVRSPSVRAFETGKVDPEAFAVQLIQEMELPIGTHEFLHAFTYWPKGLFPGALELVHRIPAQYRRAILSNTNALHWPRVMDEMGLGGAFDLSFASHIIGKFKPDAEAFEHVIAETGCHAAEILFLDDSLPNVEAAIRSGMQAVQARGVREAEAALLQAGVIRPS